MLNLKNYPAIVTLIQTNDEGNLKELEYPDKTFDDYRA